MNADRIDRINQFEFSANKRLARLKSFTTSIGLSINDKSFSSKKDKNQDAQEEDKGNRDFSTIPWDVSANYSLTYNKEHDIAAFAGERDHIFAAKPL